MTARGVFFALEDSQLVRLIEAGSDSARLEVVTEDIEERWDRQWLLEVDKAWDAIHRSLTDGTLSRTSGEEPLRWTILGGRQLYKGDSYIMNLNMPSQVSQLAAALQAVSRDRFLRGYGRIVNEDYGGSISDDDLEHTWRWFAQLPGFFGRAAGAGRAVLFTVDQ